MIFQTDYQVILSDQCRVAPYQFPDGLWRWVVVDFIEPEAYCNGDNVGVEQNSETEAGLVRFYDDEQ